MHRTVTSGIGEPVQKTLYVLYEQVYEELLAQLEVKKQEFKTTHHEEQLCLPSSSELCQVIMDRMSKCDISLSLEECVQGYKAASEALKAILNSDLDQYCIEVKIMLNVEHKEEYDQFVKRTMEELKIPTRADFVNRLVTEFGFPEQSITRSRLCLDRSKCHDASAFERCFKVAIDGLTD